MTKQLQGLMVKARDMDKVIPVRCLVKHGLNEFMLLDLEDEGMITVRRTKTDGMHIILTAKGYRAFA